MAKNKQAQVEATEIEAQEVQAPNIVSTSEAQEQAQVEANVVTSTPKKVNKDEIVDLEAKDITDIEADITTDTVFIVKRSFTANIGVNGTTGAEAGQKIKLSKLDPELTRALVKQGYIEICK